MDSLLSRSEASHGCEYRRTSRDSKQATANAAVALQRAPEDFSNAPHYSLIESFAHDAAVQFSRLVKARQAALVAVDAGATVTCPDCGKICHVTFESRDVKSINSDVDLAEAKVSCSRCERLFSLSG